MPIAYTYHSYIQYNTNNTKYTNRIYPQPNTSRLSPPFAHVCMYRLNCLVAPSGSTVSCVAAPAFHIGRLRPARFLPKPHVSGSHCRLFRSAPPPRRLQAVRRTTDGLQKQPDTARTPVGSCAQWHLGPQPAKYGVDTGGFECRAAPSAWGGCEPQRLLTKSHYIGKHLSVRVLCGSPNSTHNTP